MQSECVCAGLRMIMKERKKKKTVRDSREILPVEGQKVSAGRTFDFVVMENTKARGTDHLKTGHHVSDHFK